MFLYWNGNQQRLLLFLSSFYFLLLIKAKTVLKELDISLNWSSVLPGKCNLVSWNASMQTHKGWPGGVGWLLWLECWDGKTQGSLERKGEVVTLWANDPLECRVFHLGMDEGPTGSFWVRIKGEHAPGPPPEYCSEALRISSDLLEWVQRMIRDQQQLSYEDRLLLKSWGPKWRREYSGETL